MTEIVSVLGVLGLTVLTSFAFAYLGLNVQGNRSRRH